MSRSIRSILTSSLVVGSLVLFSAPSFAQEEAPRAPSFGDSGQFALSLNQGFVVNYGDVFSGTQVQANYFAAPHLSIGLMAGAQWLSTSPLAPSTTSLSTVLLRVGPRVGYDIPLSSAVSFWPQVGVDYRFMSQQEPSVMVTAGTQTSGSTTTITSNAFGLAVVAPIVIHPTKGFFIGAGPAFYTEFSNSTSNGTTSGDNAKVTSLGLMATIGGAF